MFLKILQESKRAEWPRFVNNAAVTGEFRRTLVGLARFWKGQARLRTRANFRRTCPVEGRVRYLAFYGPRIVDKRPANRLRMGRECANIGHFQARKPLRMVFTISRLTAVLFYIMDPMRI